MNQRAIEKTELNKILAAVAEYAVLDVSKETLCNTMPSSDLEVVKTSLDKTEECKKLLFIRIIEFKNGIENSTYCEQFFIRTQHIESAGISCN